MLTEVDVWQQELKAQQTPKSMLHHIFTRCFRRSSLLRLFIIFVLSLFVELSIWNNYYFCFDSDTFKTQEITLPLHPQLNRNALVLDKENTTVTMPPINMMVSAVEIEAYGGNFMVSGNLLATSKSYAYTPQKISKFRIGSGLNRNINQPAQDYQKVLIKFDLHEPVLQLIVNFEADTLAAPIVITKVTVNPEPELNFSLVRLLLMICGFYLIYVTVFSQLYKHQLIVDSQAYRWINRSILGAALLFATGMMLAYHPHFTTPTGFKMNPMGFLPYGNAQGTLLQEMPTTQEALGNVDLYIELTHALLVKKQLNLDLWIDPKLYNLDNVYDPTERTSKQVKFYLDRAFYDGKYYSYFGLAPFILIYAPIFLITGMVPSPVLAIYLAALMALLGMHLLSSRLTSLLCDKCNTTLFVVSKFTFYMCSLVFLLQSLLVFYLLPYLTGFAALSLCLSCGLSLLLRAKKQGQLVKGHDYIEPIAVAQEIARAQEQAEINAQNEVAEKAHQAAVLEQALEKSDQENLANKPKAVGAVIKLVKGKNRANPNELARSKDGSWSADLETKDSVLLKYWAKFIDFWRSQTSEQIPFVLDLKQMGAMLCCGLAIVLLVMSRPLNLLYVVIALGLIILLYLFRVQQSMQTKLINLGCLIVPVTLGAIVVAAYNYARFDTIFEFGQLRQLTGDMVSANTPRLNLEFLKTGFFNALFANMEFSSAFPYVTNNNHKVETGQYTYFTFFSGLFFIPYYWGLFLLPVLWKVKRLSFQGLHHIMPGLQHGLGLRCLQLTISLFYVAMLVVMFLILYNAGWSIRYLADITVVAAFLPFLFVMLINFKWQSQSERIIYLAWIGCCIVSCLLMFFMAIQNESSELELMNPRLFLELKEIFDPLGFS